MSGGAVIETGDSDLGPLTRLRWHKPDADSPPQAHLFSAAAVRDALWFYLDPSTEVFFTRQFMGIRQPHGPDVVVLPGDVLIVAAGQVVREPRTPAAGDPS